MWLLTRKEKSLLSKLLTIAMFASGALDFGSTQYALGHGKHELNPVLGQSTLRRGVIMSGGLTTIWAVTHKLHKMDGDKVADGLKVGVIASRVIAAKINLSGLK